MQCGTCHIKLITLTAYTDCPVSVNTEKFKVYFNEMLKQGIYLAPSQFESLFLSDAHTQDDLEKTAAAFDKVMEILR